MHKIQNTPVKLYKYQQQLVNGNPEIRAASEDAG